MIRLIYGGKSLADESTIAHVNMKAGDTIHMLLQLKGGFWTIKISEPAIAWRVPWAGFYEWVAFGFLLSPWLCQVELSDGFTR